jgi:ElaB/YqjD/DUF883 family membrane-anchored ribosome-binding protein
MANDNDALATQIAALRKEMATLAETVTAAAGQRGKAAAHDLADGMTEAMGYVNRRAQAADLRVESAVAANPYLALGLAAGVGLLVGALTRR